MSERKGMTVGDQLLIVGAILIGWFLFAFLMNEQSARITALEALHAEQLEKTK